MGTLELHVSGPASLTAQRACPTKRGEGGVRFRENDCQDVVEHEGRRSSAILIRPAGLKLARQAPI